ncbi:L-type lectin-domain containing receptor kinase S.4-like [Momordica charantia]|uniref:non-specific serine/threonine protein kinase n=1 Tax=Momordica charantia TaxID=3673 RepID=A0A6J1CRF8_MOMCH|nr:L-type lectin-domain containing receptor kinase S.4-like [Momordica charantia]
MAASILFITFFSSLVFLSVQTLSQHHDEFYYLGFNGATNIILKEFAEIENNGMLRLTNHSESITGQAFYSSPFQFKNSSAGGGTAFSFSTCFAFCINAENENFSGHGLTFAVVPSKDIRGSPQMFLGLFNESSNNGNSSNHVFAVEFDTNKDSATKDTDANHVGIDINSLISKESATAQYLDEKGELKDLKLISGVAVKVWIDYDSTQNILNVTISPFSSKPRRPLLSYGVDLSSIFDEEMYIGFSASTGRLASSQSILGWSFAINGQARDLDLSLLPSPPAPVKKKTEARIGVPVYVSVSVSVFVISVFAIAIFLFRNYKKSEGIEAWELQIGPHRYPYRELEKATRRFSERELLGQGGFGKVYRGILPISKTDVAVKRISHDSKQGLREFVTEISTIGMLRHRNLVQLLGWCRRRQDLLLVYEFMANGSLDKYLFDDPKSTLNWEQRFRVLKGVASALLYLHEGYERVVIHRDVKASNVLLDGELKGRLGDFGLARVYEHGSDPDTTRVVGTLGYVAPELPRTGKATTSSDVYAFGAVMLEVACGRRPVEVKALPEEMTLVDWVWEKFREGRVLDAVDPKLQGDYDEIEAAMVLKLGVMCSNNEPKQRPSMRQVVRCLDGEIGVTDEWKAPGGGGINRCAAGDFLISFTSTSMSEESSFNKLSE